VDDTREWGNWVDGKVKGNGGRIVVSSECWVRLSVCEACIIVSSVETRAFSAVINCI